MATKKKSSALKKKKAAPTTLDKARAAVFDIKKFRNEISRLKKKGLISKKYDARKVNPTKYLKKQIKEFAKVLSGQAKAVKVSKETKAAYKQAGYKTKGQKVVVEIAEGETVTVSHGRIIRKRIEAAGSFEHVEIPIRYVNLRQFLEDLREKGDALKNDNELFAFRFYDNHSWATFHDIESLIEYIETYETVADALRKDRKAMGREVYRNLEIVRVNRKYSKKWTNPPEGRQQTPRNREYQQRYAARRAERLANMTPSQKGNYNDKVAARMRKYRATMTHKEHQATLAKDAARKRAERAKKKGQANGTKPKKNRGN